MTCAILSMTFLLVIAAVSVVKNRSSRLNLEHERQMLIRAARGTTPARSRLPIPHLMPVLP